MQTVVHSFSTRSFQIWNAMSNVIDSHTSLLTLYNPGGGGFKSPPPPIFCSHAFNIGAALLCVGDFSQKIV